MSSSSAPSPAAAQRPNQSYRPLRAIAALILREMSTRYGRTPGGYIWAVLEPLGAIVILSIGFSLLLRSPSLGTSFLLFYATGYLPFNLYQVNALMISRALAFSRPLLAYPSVSWIDALVARFLLNTLSGIMVTYLLLAGILLSTDTRVLLDLGPIVEALALGAYFGLAVGALNCVIMGLFPAWDVIWSIITRPLFLMSGVIFIYEDLPQVAQDVLWYNPLLHITGIMRTGFYPMYAPGYVDRVFVLVVATIVLAAGLLLMRRFHRDILNS